MYSIIYINKIEQFNHIYCTVLIHDETSTYSDIRIDKQYSLNPNQDFLKNDCINDIYTYNSIIVDDSQVNINYSGIID